MGFFPVPPAGSSNWGYFAGGYSSASRMDRKRKRPFMDLVGGGSGKGGSLSKGKGSQGKSSLAHTTIKKGKELMNQINPLRRTEMYQKGSKAQKIAMDAAWGSVITSLFNNTPLNPINLKSPFGLPFGPTYPEWQGWPGGHFPKKKRTKSRRRRRR